MKVPSRLKANPHRPGKRVKILNEVVVICKAIRKPEAATAAGRFLNQRDVPVFGNLDGNQVCSYCRVQGVNHKVCSLEKWLFQECSFLLWLTTDRCAD